MNAIERLEALRARVLRQTGYLAQVEAQADFDSALHAAYRPLLLVLKAQSGLLTAYRCGSHSRADKALTELESARAALEAAVPGREESAASDTAEGGAE